MVPYIPIDDTPTLIADDVIILNDTTPQLRYGYFVGRPARLFKALDNEVHPASCDENDIESASLGSPCQRKTTYIKGWISSRYANQSPSMETDLILELRNHMADGKIYLEVQNWETDKYRMEK